MARQAGNEAKHAAVCEARIRQLGGLITDNEPLPEQLKMYEALDQVEHPHDS